MSHLQARICFRKTYGLLFLLGGIASLAGCAVPRVDVETRARADKQTEARVEALEQTILTASVALCDAAKKISKLGPLAAKDTCSEPMELTTLTQNLQAQIDDLSQAAAGTPIGLNDRLRLEILSVIGAVRVQIWLDDGSTSPVVPGLTFVGRSEQFASNLLGMKFDIASTTIREWSRQQTSATAFSIYAQGKSGDIDAAYKKQVDKQLEAFLSAPYPYHEPEVRSIDFDMSRWSPGQHVVKLRIRPQHKDALSGKWAITYQLISWNDNQPETTLKKIAGGSLSSDEKEYSAAPLGEWIDPPQSISVDPRLVGSGKNSPIESKP